MAYEKVFNILVILLAFVVVDSYESQVSTKLPEFSLSDAHIRHARLRCLQQFPQADVANYSDTSDTQCFLQCFLYKMGLMDLTTRGLDSFKFIEIWEQIEEAFKEDTCLERFDFSEALNGNCSDTYRKLADPTKRSKKIGQSAKEWCDLIEKEDIVAKETSQDEEVSLLTQYKDKLKCIFENIHYLDAYGRVDETEINLSYQEAQEDSTEARAVIHTCSHRANAKYQTDYFGNMALELQKCLKSFSPVYDKVLKLRDETSRQY